MLPLLYSRLYVCKTLASHLKSKYYDILCAVYYIVEKEINKELSMFYNELIQFANIFYPVSSTNNF